jgi:hypothetical protein
VAPAEGATLTQGAVTATVKRVVLESGTWASSTAAGRFVIDTPVGGSTHFIAAAATIDATTMTLAGAESAITLPAGGTYVFDIGNFYGQSATRRIYGANGVGYCFEFDGTVLTPIHTGFSPDTPAMLVIHREHLMIGIGSSLGISGLGTPYNWTALADAAEIAVGDTLTDLKVQPGAQETPTLLVTTAKGLFMLYGTSSLGSNPWSLVTYNAGVGARSHSLQNMSRTYMVNDRGVMDLYTADSFGNFLQATLTSRLQDFMTAKRSLLAASLLNMDRSQYRLFFSDGTGLYVTIVNGKLHGSMPITFPTPVACAWAGEDASGDPVSYIGCTNGMVYQLDKGSSFDGDAIVSYLVLAWDAVKSPRVLKRYRRASLEIQGQYYAEFSFGYTLGYGTTTLEQATPKTYSTNFSGTPNWDTFVWDEFNWDGATLSPSEVEMRGTAENYQLVIRAETDYLYPFTINSTIVHYSDRRRVR